ncbi:MAG: class I SAM-dependent methyltransferase [Ilumatobacteraceae bacterium]
MSSAPPADDGSDQDVFDEPSRWRLAAVRSLGLVGEERIAGVITGAAYPDALTTIVDRLTGVRGVVCDVGAGLGGASQWMASRIDAPVVAVEPEATSVTAAAELFPELGLVQGAATAIPIGTRRAGAVTLLGVLSLVEDLDVVLAEVARVLTPGGVVGITDLCTVRDDRWAPPGSANVFRRAEHLTVALAEHGMRVSDRWSAPADLGTSWQDVGGRVDDEIVRRFAAEPAYAAWRDDRARLAEEIEAGALIVETLVAEAPVAGGRAT